MRKVLFLATMLAFVMTSSVWAADLSGIWTIKFIKVDGAEDSFDAAIKDANGNLTITGNHSQLGALSGSGIVKGDTVNMDIKATGSLPIEFIFAGKVTGNKISGTRDIKMTDNQSGSTSAGGGQGGQGSATGQASNAFTAEKK